MKNDVVGCMNLIIELSNPHCMKINPDKSELLLLHTPSLTKEVIINGVLFEDQCIHFSEVVKKVVVQIDQDLSIVTNIVSHCYKNFKRHWKYQKMP